MSRRTVPTAAGSRRSQRLMAPSPGLARRVALATMSREKNMLEYLHPKNVGPARELTMELAPRLNVITGDNGFGKSFLLDIAWWALTRRWPGEVNPRLTSGMKALPYERGAATIEFRFTGKNKRDSYTSTFDRMAQAWTGRAGRPAN